MAFLGDLLDFWSIWGIFGYKMVDFCGVDPGEGTNRPKIYGYKPPKWADLGSSLLGDMPGAWFSVVLAVRLGSRKRLVRSPVHVL